MKIRNFNGYVDEFSNSKKIDGYYVVITIIYHYLKLFSFGYSYTKNNEFKYTSITCHNNEIQLEKYIFDSTVTKEHYFTLVYILLHQRSFFETQVNIGYTFIKLII